MRSIFTEAGQRGDSIQTAIQQAHKAHSFPIFFFKTKKMGRGRPLPLCVMLFLIVTLLGGVQFSDTSDQRRRVGDDAYIVPNRLTIRKKPEEKLKSKSNSKHFLFCFRLLCCHNPPGRMWASAPTIMR